MLNFDTTQSFEKNKMQKSCWVRCKTPHCMKDKEICDIHLLTWNTVKPKHDIERRKATCFPSTRKVTAELL